MKLNFFLTAAALLPVFFSCSKPNEIGEEVLSEKLNVAFTDTISVIAHTVNETSLFSSSPFATLAGSYTDPTFGKVFGGFYSQFSLPTNSITFQENPQLDSIVMSLSYMGAYGDTTKAQSFTVYELNQNLRIDSSYASNRVFDVKPQSIGNITFVPRLKDSVMVGGKKKGPQLRIRLNDEVGHVILNAINTGKINSNDGLLELFKGVYVRPEPAEDASIVYFNPVSDQTKITIYYRIGTAAAALELFSGSRASKHNYFSHNHSGYISDTTVNSTVKSDSLLYMQSMAGLKVRLSLPYIQKLGGKAAINKAELVIPVAEDPNSSKYPRPAQLYLFSIDSAGKSSILLDQLEGSNYYGGTYNATAKEYRFNISWHIQRILKGAEQNQGLYLVVGNPLSSAERVVLLGNINAPRKLKIRLTYTKLD